MHEHILLCADVLINISEELESVFLIIQIYHISSALLTVHFYAIRKHSDIDRTIDVKEAIVRFSLSV